MKIFTESQEAQLRANFSQQLQDPNHSIDFQPVLKLFCGNATWLLTELDDDDRLFGLCDLGLGFPELGYVSLAELESLNVFPPLERDRYFQPETTLSEYANQARKHGRIVA